MRSYSITSPPKTPGIYGLRNLKTGQFYVGQTVNLQRRRVEWTGLLTTKIGRTNKGFFEQIQNTEAADWEFLVILGVDDVTQLNRLEARMIERVRAKIGDLCMNGQQHKTLKGQSNTKKTTVIGPDGQSMTYREAAAHLGKSVEWVKKRAVKWRSRGVLTLPAEQLAAHIDSLQNSGGPP